MNEDSYSPIHLNKTTKYAFDFIWNDGDWTNTTNCNEYYYWVIIMINNN